MLVYHIKQGYKRLWEERDNLIEAWLSYGQEPDNDLIDELLNAAVMLERIYRGEILIEIGEQP